MRILAAVGITLAIAALVAKLAVAPLYGRYTAAQCHAAYNEARSRADTARLDLHPYDAPDEKGKHVCGEVRGPTVSTPADLSALR